MLIWAQENRLDPDSHEAVQSTAEAVFVSAATIWEIEIKRAQGRLEVPGDMAEVVRQAEMQALPISFEHARDAGRLPPLHADPFDRMLIAQARGEGLTLATADRRIMRYDVPVLPVSHR